MWYIVWRPVRTSEVRRRRAGASLHPVIRERLRWDMMKGNRVDRYSLISLALVNPKN
jgi:hypothetical protein